MHVINQRVAAPNDAPRNPKKLEGADGAGQGMLAGSGIAEDFCMGAKERQWCRRGMLFVTRLEVKISDY